jgi:multisubunit Na+/H+ antiporter MnhE subunit
VAEHTADEDDGSGESVVRELPEVLLWWAACVGTWLLTLSSVSTPELVAAVAAGLPCSVVAVLARRAVRGPLSPRPAWLRWLLPVPVAVLADSARVLGVAAGALLGRRIPDGDLRRVTLPEDRSERDWQNRQAAAVVLGSASPGSVVLDVDPESGEALVHELAAGRPDPLQAVRR